MSGGGVREILLTRGCVALVDEADFARVAALKWTTLHAGPEARAVHYWRSGSARGSVGLGRFILDAPPGLLVDHINGDPLDNRRCNLRLCSHAENMRNRRKHRGEKIGRNPFKGVHPAHKRWRAVIRFEGVTRHLGCFDSPEEAARAYDRAAATLFGEFARLNFPEAA